MSFGGVAGAIPLLVGASAATGHVGLSGGGCWVSKCMGPQLILGLLQFC